MAANDLHRPICLRSKNFSEKWLPQLIGLGLSQWKLVVIGRLVDAVAEDTNCMDQRVMECTLAGYDASMTSMDGAVDSCTIAIEIHFYLVKCFALLMAYNICF